MHGIFFDIGLGAGLAGACGLRPFLPVLLAGALASGGDLGVSFANAPFRFLEANAWLVGVAGALAVAYVLQLTLRLSPVLDPADPKQRPDPLAATLAGVAIGAGGLMFGGTLAAHHNVWWPGVLGGLACVALAQRVSWPIAVGARKRLPDRGAREAVTIYLDLASLIAAALVCALHPLGYVLVALLAWFWWRRRARAAEKYAGLRILRR